MKKLRHQVGLSQSEVARRMKVVQPFVSKIESKGYNPGALTVIRYANAIGARLGIEPDSREQMYIQHIVYTSTCIKREPQSIIPVVEADHGELNNLSTVVFRSRPSSYLGESLAEFLELPLSEQAEYV